MAIRYYNALKFSSEGFFFENSNSAVEALYIMRFLLAGGECSGVVHRKEVLTSTNFSSILSIPNDTNFLRVVSTAFSTLSLQASSSCFA